MANLAASPKELTMLIGVMGTIILLFTAGGMFVNLPGAFTAFSLARYGPETVQKIIEYMPGPGAKSLSSTLLNINRAWPRALREPLFMFFGITLDLFYWLFMKDDDINEVIKILGYLIIANHLIVGTIVNYGIYENDVCTAFNNSLPGCGHSFRINNFVSWLFYFEIIGLAFYAFIKNFAEIIGGGGGFGGGMHGIKTALMFAIGDVLPIYVYLTAFSKFIFI